MRSWLRTNDRFRRGNRWMFLLPLPLFLLMLLAAILSLLARLEKQGLVP